jgi:quercetin dioxygenase-like cupin family protein
VRYTIPVGVTLPPHTHPGVQMNVIEAGTLTYYVVADGEILVTRADGEEETFGPGESTTFAVGDAFTEPAGIVHYGANLDSEPVVILTAALLASDEPPSTLVEATPAASR